MENSETEDLRLKQGPPNTVNTKASIDYRVPEKSVVTLRLYDVKGTEVAVLVDKVQPAGEYSIVLNEGDLPPGDYYYKLSAGTSSKIMKLTVRK